MLLSLLVPAALSMTTNDLVLCTPQQLTQIVPEVGAVEVPIDVVPQLLFSEGGCPSDMELWVSLLSVDGDAEVALHEELVVMRPSDRVPWLPLDLQEEMQPETDYILRVSEGEFVIAEVAFATGVDRLDEVSGAPILDSVNFDHTRSRRVESWWLDAVIAPGAPMAPYSVVLLRNADAPEEAVAAGVVDERDLISLGGSPTDTMSLDTACLEAVQMDGRGEEVGVSEVVCVDAQRSGCSSAGGPPPRALGVAALALLGLTLRRRRSAAV